VVPHVRCYDRHGALPPLRCHGLAPWCLTFAATSGTAPSHRFDATALPRGASRSLLRAARRPPTHQSGRARSFSLPPPSHLFLQSWGPPPLAASVTIHGASPWHLARRRWTRLACSGERKHPRGKPVAFGSAGLGGRGGCSGERNLPRGKPVAFGQVGSGDARGRRLPARTGYSMRCTGTNRGIRSTQLAPGPADDPRHLRVERSRRGPPLRGRCGRLHRELPGPVRPNGKSILFSLTDRSSRTRPSVPILPRRPRPWRLRQLG
jgi:hypothetical protein